MSLVQQAQKKKLPKQRLVELMKLFCILIKTLSKKSTGSRKVLESTSFMTGLEKQLFTKASCESDEAVVIAVKTMLKNW